MKPLHALSVRQPWAHAIAWGTKRIENRVWSPDAGFLGSYLAIHASKAKVTEDELDGFRFISELVPRERRWHPRVPTTIVGELPLGAVVAVARLVRVIRGVGDGFDAEPQCADPWFVGPCGLVLDDVTPLLEPVPMRGQLGIFAAPDEAAALVRERWKKARAEGLHADGGAK